MGRAPNSGANPHDWTVEVKGLLGNLCTTKKKNVVVRGALACEEYVSVAEDKFNKKTATLSDYQMPIRFSWLLDPTTVVMIHTQRKALQDKEKNL